MSLKIKIILSFLISSITVIIFSIFFCVNFVEIKKEIQYLELSDTIRSKSLQLRRHEKNFFLYGDIKEIDNVHTYLKDLKLLLKESTPVYNTETLLSLENKINEYSQRFNHIEILVWDFQNEFNRLKPLSPKNSVLFPIIEATFLERPLVNAELLKKVFSQKPGDPSIKYLQELHGEIGALRKNGEEILIISKDLDKSAREKVEKAMGLSQKAGLILFPLFFIVSLGSLFVISQSVVSRLKILTKAIEKTGRGDFLSLSVPREQDEVGALMNSFNKMELDLIKRDEELKKKNEELLQSRKLASIGTLASGVAHELNNPLNNIYLAAQILSREIGHETCPPMIRETVGDIFSQTIRVKRIVSDLLEFSREKPPDLKQVNIKDLIEEVLNQMEIASEMSDVQFNLRAPEDIEVFADKHLLQQVFINLFNNAVDAMEGKGFLDIGVTVKDDSVSIKISDTGKGIPSRDISRIFDPFFTTKEKGTGLGLAIVYSIIEKHKGKIEVASKPNAGTTFNITIPRGK
ncbi:MAG: ATP-binding protein [Nitrospirota bacterium]